MNFGCFWGHDWENINTVIVESSGKISSSSRFYPTLGEEKRSDRICRKCDKVEFNAEAATVKDKEIRAEEVKVKQRFEKFKSLRNKANGKS